MHLHQADDFGGLVDLGRQAGGYHLATQTKMMNPMKTRMEEGWMTIHITLIDSWKCQQRVS